jgi:hypothetical protein
MVTSAAHDDSLPRSAEQRGNITNTHRELLGKLSPDPGAGWSTRALWACLEELRHSVITEAAEVRVEWAWTDGPTAFCVVYRPPYQPGDRVGLRRQADDGVVLEYGTSSVLYLERASGEADVDGLANPIAFGVAVAAFDVGEPLGTSFNELRFDDEGVGWWGSIDTGLPSWPAPR